MMTEIKPVPRRDYDQAMRLLGLVTDPNLALVSVSIKAGVVTAEYTQRTRVEVPRGGIKFPPPPPAPEAGQEAR